jgi:F0F1-type ATP synthase gamma subunit
MTILSKHMMEAAFIKNEELKNDIFQENKIDFDEICAGYGYFYLANKLYQVFLESMYQENRQRILAMTQAKTNAEDMGKIIDRLYNRARQEKITMELNEIASSVMEQ